MILILALLVVLALRIDCKEVKKRGIILTFYQGFQPPDELNVFARSLNENMKNFDYVFLYSGQIEFSEADKETIALAEIKLHQV